MTETISFIPDFSTIEVSIGEQKIEIINHFSLKLSLKFIKESDKTKDFRQAFIESVYDMYTKTIATKQENDSIKISKNEFLDIEESELTEIFQEILKNDRTTFEIYQQIDCVDQYERYYLALKKLFQKSTQMIESSIQKTMDSFKSIIEPIQMYKIDHLISPINDLITPMDHFINPIKIDFSNIHFNEKWKESFAFAESIQRASSIFHNQLTGVISEFDYISNELNSIISNALQPTFDMLATINTGLDYVDLHYKERHETMRRFGWWYLSDLDEELLEKIYLNQDNMTIEDVDQLICNYYRNDKCNKLKKWLRVGRGLNIFKQEKLIFIKLESFMDKGIIILQ